MCELLGLSSNRETTINLSLTTLSERGEKPSMHGDGWGIAFHEGKDVRLIKDVGEAKNSPWVDFIKKQEIHSHDIIAHIRKSTIGEVNYSNTHPFTRELFGRVHSFAHNGTLKNFLDNEYYVTKHFHPIGSTDSEKCFCILMDRMFDLWSEYEDDPPLEARTKVVRKFADEIRALGPSNFLYADGEAFFAHGDERHDPILDKIIWPGLHYLHVTCEENNKNFKHSSETGIAIEGHNDTVTMFASVPLNDSHWRPLKRGELMVVLMGRIMYTL